MAAELSSGVSAMMFGSGEGRQDTPAAGNADFKGLVSTANPDKDAKVFQSQLGSLVQLVPAFD